MQKKSTSRSAFFNLRALIGLLLCAATAYFILIPARSGLAFLHAPSNLDGGTWTITDNLNTARFLHAVTLLPNGMALVTAGLDNTFQATPSAELYDPASGTWTATGSLNTARYEHTATLLPNGKVLVAGGRDSGGDGFTRGGRGA